MIFIFPSRNKTLIFKAIFDIVSFIQLLFVYLYSRETIVFVAMTGNVIGLIRDIIFLLQNKYRWANSIILLILFELCFVIAGIISWRSPICLFNIIGSVISTFALYLKNNLYRTSLSLFAMSLQVTYYALILDSSNLLTTLNVIAHALICVSCVVGIINIICYHQKKIKIEKEKPILKD